MTGEDSQDCFHISGPCPASPPTNPFSVYPALFFSAHFSQLDSPSNWIKSAPNPFVSHDVQGGSDTWCCAQNQTLSFRNSSHDGLTFRTQLCLCQKRNCEHPNRRGSIACHLHLCHSGSIACLIDQCCIRQYHMPASYAISLVCLNKVTRHCSLLRLI